MSASYPQIRLTIFWISVVAMSELLGGRAIAMTLTSTTFQTGQPIPAQYTCDGANISPPLAWSGAPDGTASFALIADDPDAPAKTWVHWVVYHIPASEQHLPERLPAQERLPNGVMQGLTDFRRTGYGGPCPPSGTHRYVFTLYALDVASLDLPAQATKTQLLKTMDGHILAHAALMGTYQRSP